MTKEAKLFTVLSAVAAGLLLILLCVVLPLSLSKAEEETPTIPTEGDESAVGETLLLFGPYQRQEIESITVTNDKETYSFVHPGQDVYSFRIRQDGVTYEDLLPNDETLAQIVVATGTPYVRTRVTATDGKVIAYENYGLAESQSPAYYEIKLYDGKAYKVYVGDKTADENGYFVRVEGRDTVYVTLSPTMGQLVNSVAGDFFKASLFPAMTDQYAYYFVDGFSIRSEIRDYGKNPDGTPNGRRVLPSDTVFVTVETVRTVNGTEATRKTEQIRVNLAAPHTDLAVKALLLDAPVATDLSLSPITKTEQMSAGGGTSVTVVTTTTYKRIEYAASRPTDIAFDFIKDANDRDFFHSGALYTITGPDEAKNYTANDNYIMTMLPKLAELTGTKVLHLGAFDDTGALKSEYAEKYGLYRYTLSFRFPKKYELLEVNPDAFTSMEANSVVVKEEDYVSVTLYFSERQKDGTYYVASDVYGTVSVCEADSLDFLEAPLSSWIDDQMIASYMDYVKNMKLEFFYSDFTGSYDFDVAGIVKRQDEFDNWYNATIPLNGSHVNYKNFEEVYYYLLWQRYAGETGLSADATAAVLAGTPILKMTVSLIDGRVFTYSFYPYSGRRVLVSVASSTDASDQSTAFYVTLPQVERLSEAFRLFEAGTPIDLRKGQK